MDSLDIIMGAAKKDKRFAKMKDPDAEDKDESKDTSEDSDTEGGLEDVFSARQAAAIREYVDSCK